MSAHKMDMLILLPSFFPSFVRMSWTINYNVKSNSKIKNYKYSFQLESILIVKSILLQNNQIFLNQI